MRALIAAALLLVSMFAEAQLTVVRSFGPVTINAGTEGFMTHPNPLPSNLSQVVIKVQQIGWPLAGGPAIDDSIDYSPDGGVTWFPVGGEEILDVAQGGARGVPAGEFRLFGSIPDVGSTTRFIRLHYVFIKTLRVSGTIEVQ